MTDSGSIPDASTALFRETWALFKRRPYLICWPVLIIAWILRPPRKEPEWWRGESPA